MATFTRGGTEFEFIDGSTVISIVVDQVNGKQNDTGSAVLTLYAGGATYVLTFADEAERDVAVSVYKGKFID